MRCASALCVLAHSRADNMHGSAPCLAGWSAARERFHTSACSMRPTRSGGAGMPRTRSAFRPGRWAISRRQRMRLARAEVLLVALLKHGSREPGQALQRSLGARRPHLARARAPGQVATAYGAPLRTLHLATRLRNPGTGTRTHWCANRRHHGLRPVDRSCVVAAGVALRLRGAAFKRSGKDSEAWKRSDASNTGGVALASRTRSMGV